MIARLTNPIFISWYLSAVFALGLFASSAMSVVPKAKALAAVFMIVCSACVLLFAASAIILRHRSRLGLSLGVLGSRPLRIGYAAFAAVITLGVLVLVGG